MLRRGRYRAIEGEYYGTPKEIWDFRYPTRGRTDVARALGFLEEHASLFGLEGVLPSLAHDATYLGACSKHVVFTQKIHQKKVRRGWVSVHLDPTNRVYLVKNRAVPLRLWPSPANERAISEEDAAKKAKRSLSKDVIVHDVQRMWFPEEDRLEPVFRVRLRRLRPREWWRVIVHARTGKILHKYDNVANARPRAWVFDPNPVVTLGDHTALLGTGRRLRQPPPECYREVRLLGLGPSGRLEGQRVSTKLTDPLRRIKAKNGDFRVHSHQVGFDEVMAYYHLDAAIRYLRSLGYRGRRAIFKRTLLVDANGTRQDNAWYDPATRSLVFGTGGIDSAEDAELILHEFGHAMQDAICPEFGQSDQAAAMGEGFGDYFAASYFEAKKTERRYHPTVMSWNGLLYGLDSEFDPPCVRRLDSDRTFAGFEPDAEYPHDNGEIWAAALWDVRRRLGRDRADRIIIESHFQLDPFTTFARGARAILDANEHLFAGDRRSALERVFRARGIDLRGA